MIARSDSVRRWGHVLVAAGVIALVVGLFAPIAQADPPGNNGTVKIDKGELDGDSNQPHVGCDFFVEWFGFEAGATSNVTFTMQAPTNTPKVPGSPDFSAFGPFTLDSSGDGAHTFNILDLLTNFTPQPPQGFHVKLTVETSGSQGADTKFKTFWVTGCVPPEPVVGSITLDKVVLGDGAPNDDPTFTFTVDCDDADAVVTSPVSIKASDPATPVASNVAAGTSCTITETDDNDASATSYTVDGGASQNGDSAEVEVTDDSVIAVVFTNQYEATNPVVGSITLDKVLAGTGIPTTDPTFTFTVDCDDPDAFVTSPASIKASDSAATIATNVSIGTKCTITETVDNGASSTSFTIDGGAPTVASSVEVTVSSSTAVAAVATNTFAASVLGEEITSTTVAARALARTGTSSSAGLVVVGTILVLMGSVLVRLSKRTAPVC